MKNRPVPHEQFLTPSMGAPWGTHGGLGNQAASG